MPITLAASELFNQLLPWLGGLVVLAVLGAVIMSAARRLLTSDPLEPRSTGFTLDELRTLRDRGELTQEEFDRAKSRFVRMAQRSSSAATAGGKAPAKDRLPPAA